jgi:hypothetical protein
VDDDTTTPEARQNSVPSDDDDAGTNQQPNSTSSGKSETKRHKFTTTRALPEKQYPAHLKVIIERAIAGDQTVLPELKKAFNECAEWTELFGDLFENARQDQLQLLAGANLLSKEAIVRGLDKLRIQGQRALWVILATYSTCALGGLFLYRSSCDGPRRRNDGKHRACLFRRSGRVLR